MMKKIYIFFLSAISFDYVSCKQDNRAAEYVKNLNTDDTFLFDVIKRKTPKEDSDFFEYKRAQEKFLNLKSINNGYDSIQIRIHYGCFMGVSEYIVLRNNGTNWTAEAGEIREYYNDSSWLKLDSVIWLKKQVIPKSGWGKFISRLFGLQILSLPDNNKIPGFHYYAPSDGCYSSFEIATKKAYRYYDYDNPNMYDTIYWQAKNVLSILRLINHEFGMEDKVWPEPEGYWDNKIDTTPIKKTEVNLIDIYQEDSSLIKKRSRKKKKN